MIVLDTSALVDVLTGKRRSAPRLRAFLDEGERVLITTIVLYEWLRGPRRPEEIADQEVMFPAVAALPFGPDDAQLAAQFYRTLPRARARMMDFTIAATAIVHSAALWTLNPSDFREIPGLTLA
jgi:predicted nucleic acid-binding protein